MLARVPRSHTTKDVDLALTKSSNPPLVRT